MTTTAEPDYAALLAFSAKEEQAYQEAYGYLLRHKDSMSYAEYRRRGLPSAGA